jgi:hypothetical protein
MIDGFLSERMNYQQRGEESVARIQCFELRPDSSIKILVRETLN